MNPFAWSCDQEIRLSMESAMGDGMLLARVVLAIATLIFALAVIQAARADATAHRAPASVHATQRT